MNKYQEAMNYLWNAYDENKIYGIASRGHLETLQELVNQVDSFEWIPFTFDEEGVLNCELPDIEEDILVWNMDGTFDKENVWIDTWESPDFGVYELESGMDLEGLAWMSLPYPYKEKENER